MDSTLSPFYDTAECRRLYELRYDKAMRGDQDINATIEYEEYAKCKVKHGTGVLALGNVINTLWPLLYVL